MLSFTFPVSGYVLKTMDYTVSRHYCTTGFFIYLSYLPNRGVVEKNYCWFLLLPKRYVYKETEQMLTMQAPK